MTDDHAIEVSRLTKTYGSGADAVRAIESVDLQVRRGEFVSVVGPSGCGKTTLLMSIARLREISRGEVLFGGKRIDAPVRGMSVVFQDYSRSLFPWFTVEKNVRLALWDSKEGTKEDRAKVTEVLEAVGLEQFGASYPWQLSGGMQQRVALARALVTSPEVLLMDEPFASVDAQTRIVLEDLLLKLWREFGTTIVFITHDLDEAVYLSDRVVVLSGRPATVLEELSVPIQRPRDQVTTRASQQFITLRSRVYELVMGTRV